MDDSQSSDVFSEKDGLPPNISDEMDELFTNLQSALSQNVQNGCSDNSSFSLHFLEILSNSEICVNQKLDLVIIILEDPESLITKLCEVLEDIVSLLQLLSAFLKNVLEAVTMTCASLKTFPAATGQILLQVFSHCKESETLYGTHLHHVESQLKSLFKACHELQLVYLMILEKHFIFDLAETEELDVLLKALEINLRIGDIVQALDLKTMAEQWKAFTMICERYSHYLIDKSIFQETTMSLCCSIMNNVKIACEGEDEKLTARSLKVSSFVLKILFKLCHIFKHAVDKRYNDILELLIKIQTYYSSIALNKSNHAQFSQAFSVNVLTQAEAIVSELLSDDLFIQNVLQYDRRSKHTEDPFVGFSLLLISVIKCLIQSADVSVFAKWMSGSRGNLFSCIFHSLSQGHTSFNLEYKFNISSHQYFCGLYEYLLMHTSLLTLHCTPEQYGIVEGEMCAALLGTDVYSAMFASDLWVSLASVSPSKLTLNQLIFLCETYKELHKTSTFTTAPQETYFSHTITRLFKSLPKEEKYKVYNNFDIKCTENKILWVVMKVKNLPDSYQRNAEELVVDDLKRCIGNMMGDHIPKNGIGDAILQMKLAATCSFVVSENIIDIVVSAWLKICPNTNGRLQCKELNKENVWLLDYVDALQELTVVLLRYFQRNSQCVLKVLHVISELVSSSFMEIKLALINLIFKLTVTDIVNNRHTIDELLDNIYRNIFKENDYVFKTKLFEISRLQVRNKRIEEIVSKVIQECNNKEEWDNVMKYGTLKENSLNQVHNELKATENITFTHKCLPNIISNDSEAPLSRVNSQKSMNFEFNEVEELFRMDSGIEPAVKKTKPNTDEIESILEKLDGDITALANIKVPLDSYRHKIVMLSAKLKAIVN